MSAWDMGKIMDALRENFNIVKDAEITIEGNPATLFLMSKDGTLSA